MWSLTWPQDSKVGAINESKPSLQFSMKQFDLVHSSTPEFSKIYLNILFLSTLRCLK
jgi:hypothetical protein